MQEIQASLRALEALRSVDWQGVPYGEDEVDRRVAIGHVIGAEALLRMAARYFEVRR